MFTENKIKNLFAFGFALCLSGIVIRFNPEYLIKLLTAFNMIDIVSKDAIEANQDIKTYGSIQTLLGGGILGFSGFWINKRGKNLQKED